MARPIAYFALTVVIDADGYHTVSLQNGRPGIVDGNRCTGPQAPADAAKSVRELAENLAESFERSHAELWHLRPNAPHGGQA